MNFESLLYSVSQGVAVITLNRPEAMNSWTPQLSDELSLAMGAADANDDVRAVIVTATGRAFCAGADLSAGEGGFLSGKGGKQAGPRLMPYQVRKPVIAAINGHAVGVGITYPMLCDIRIVADNAKIQFAMVRRGILPELGSHALLPRIVGFSRASDLLLTGRMIFGTEAAQLGLVSQALPAELVLNAALDIATDIAINVAPVSAALAKKLLWEGMTMSVEDMITTEGLLLPVLAQASDSGEGVRAFFEKRAPRWLMKVSKDVPNIPSVR